MRHFPRLVPWASQAEWDDIYSWLYAPAHQLHLREAGVRRVQAWSQRCKVPHAIESTAALVEAGIRDVLNGHVVMGQLGTSDRELRQLLSMAIVRFVNGITDSGQTGLYARSITSLAQEIGLPLYLVDIRHTATHDYLPTLAVLRRAAQQALRWLDEHYWSIQQTHVVRSTEEIRRQLEAYKFKRGSADRQKQLSIFVEAIAPLEGAKELLIQSLLSPQNECLMSLDACGEAGAIEARIPVKTERLWEPALNKFCETWPDFYEDLVFAMMDVINTSDVDSASPEAQWTSWCCIAWLKYLLSTKWLRRWAPYSNNDEEVDDGIKNEPETDYHTFVKDILEAALWRPSKFTNRLIEHIMLLVPNISSCLKSFIEFSNLLSTLEQREIAPNMDGTLENQDLTRLQGLLADIQGLQGSAMSTQPSDAVSWTLESVEPLKPPPLGSLSGEVVDLSLPAWLNDPRSGVYVQSSFAGLRGWDYCRHVVVPEDEQRTDEARPCDEQNRDKAAVPDVDISEPVEFVVKKVNVTSVDDLKVKIGLI